MGLGGTAKTLQTLADRAEQLFEQLKQLQKRVVNLEESVEDSTRRLDRLEVEAERQRVLLEAIAEAEGIDAEQVLAEAAIAEAEPDESEAAAGTSADAGAPDELDSGAPSSGDGDAASPEEPTVVDEQGDPIE